MPGWVVDRYGDIWGGFILKTLMDLRGEALAVGEPMIDHLKEGDFLRNIWQEHVDIAVVQAVSPAPVLRTGRLEPVAFVGSEGGSR